MDALRSVGDEVKPRTAAELSAFAAYPGLEASMDLAEYCERREDRPTRAFGTGTGPIAHAEAQESGALQAEYERGRSEPREYISRGGRR